MQRYVAAESVVAARMTMATTAALSTLHPRRLPGPA